MEPAYRDVHRDGVEEVNPAAPVSKRERDGGARMETSLVAVKSDGAPIQVKPVEYVVDCRACRNNDLDGGGTPAATSGKRGRLDGGHVAI